MPGLVPGIHDFSSDKQDVDGRTKCGHDGEVNAPPPVRWGAGTPGPVFLLSKKRNGAPGGARALRYGALVAPVRYAGHPSAPCWDGGANPIPRRARAVISRLAKPRHRTAAPPGAPPRTQASLRKDQSRIVGGPIPDRLRGAS